MYNESKSGKDLIDMKKFDVVFKTLADVQKFVNIVNRYSYDVDLTSGKYVVDAKSIMGIFSLDLSKPITIELHSDDTAALENELKSFKA